MKTCSKCKDVKEVSNFEKDRSRKDGRYPQCKECRKSYREEHREAARARHKAWHKANQESERARSKAYYKANKAMSNARRSHHRSLSRGATPCECCTYEQLIQFYIDRPKSMTVDHIIPCSKRGKHCILNLQYLTKSENSKKGVS